MCGCQSNTDPATSAVLAMYRLPFHNGIVTWLGIDWYGIPYPIRLYVIAWRVLARAWAGESVEVPDPSVFSGCGCIKRLKDLVSP